MQATGVPVQYHNEGGEGGKERRREKERERERERERQEGTKDQNGMVLN